MSACLIAAAARAARMELLDAHVVVDVYYEEAQGSSPHRHVVEACDACMNYARRTGLGLVEIHASKVGDYLARARRRDRLAPEGYDVEGVRS